MELSRAQLREFARDIVAVSLSQELKSLYTANSVVTGAVMMLPRNAKKLFDFARKSAKIIRPNFLVQK